MKQLNYNFSNIHYVSSTYETDKLIGMNTLNELDYSTMKEHTEKVLQEDLSLIPDWEFRSLGKLFMLSEFGAQLSPEDIEYRDTKMKVLLGMYQKVISTPPVVKKRGKELMLYQYIEDEILLGTKNIENIKRKIDEFTKNSRDTALEKLNVDINDEYIADDIKEFYTKVIEILKASKMLTNPQEKKELSVFQKIKNTLHLKEFQELKSVKLEKVFDSVVLYVYDTNNRKLSRYVAKEGMTLEILRCDILNYDTEKSFRKTIRENKVNEVLNEMNTIARVPARKLFESINSTPQEVTGRTGRNIILFRTEKVD